MCAQRALLSMPFGTPGLAAPWKGGGHGQSKTGSGISSEPRGDLLAELDEVSDWQKNR